MSYYSEPRTGALDATPACIVVRVPTPPPLPPMPGLNILLRRGGGWTKHRWVKHAEGYVLEAKANLHPNARRVFPLQKACLRVTVFYCGSVEPDEVNLAGPRKIMEDALVNVGILAGDTRAHLPLVETVAVHVPHMAERRVVVEVWPRQDGS